MIGINETQLEALQVAKTYIGKLAPEMELLVIELRGERKEDTDDYIKLCMDGLNWVVELYNGTIDLFEKESGNIDRNEINQVMINLSNALKDRDDSRTSKCLEEGVIPFLHNLDNEIQIIIT